MTKATEQNIQRFWSDSPMIPPGNDFNWHSVTLEEIYAHGQRLIRSDKGSHFQGLDVPILEIFIGYSSMLGATVLEIGCGVGRLLSKRAADWFVRLET